MVRWKWAAPIAGFVIASCSLGANAGGFIGLEWTNAFSVSAETDGFFKKETLGGTQFFNEMIEFKSGTDDISFTVRGFGEQAGPGTIDRYDMRATTEGGWSSESYSTTFDFGVLDNDVVMQYAEAGYFGSKKFTAPTMTIFSGGTEIAVLTELGNTFDLSAGMNYQVTIGWSQSPLFSGDYAQAAFTLSPAAVPGAGALAILGCGATSTRRRRKG